jgi:hypothetical protein
MERSEKEAPRNESLPSKQWDCEIIVLCYQLCNYYYIHMRGENLVKLSCRSNWDCEIVVLCYCSI